MFVIASLVVLFKSKHLNPNCAMARGVSLMRRAIEEKVLKKSSWVKESCQVFFFS